MSEKKVPETTAPAVRPTTTTENAALTDEELNKVAGGAASGIDALIRVTQQKTDNANSQK